MITLQGSYAGINTVRNLSLIQRSLSKTMQKLAAGERVDTVADGPAELVISEQMRAQIGSLTEQIRGLEFRLNRNAAADKAVDELDGLVREMKQVVQTASDEVENTPESGRAFQDRIVGLVGDFNRRREEAAYGSQKLLDGSAGAVVAIPKMREIEISTPDQAREAIADVDRIARIVDESKVRIEEETRNEYELTMRNLEVASQNMTAAESSIYDRDFATEQARQLRSIVQQNAVSAASAQGPLTSDTVFKLLHA